MSGFKVRPVTPGDLPDIAGMSGALGAFHGENTRVTVAALTRDLFGSPPWCWGLIATDGDKAIGYALMLPTAQIQHGRRGLDLHHIFVIEDRRGQGIGRALVRQVEALARDFDASYVTIGTDPQNTGAQAAYQAMGYARRDPGPRFAKKLA